MDVIQQVIWTCDKTKSMRGRLQQPELNGSRVMWWACELSGGDSFLFWAKLKGFI